MPADDLSTQPQRPAAGNTASALLLAVSILWCIYWFVHARGYWEDDAYIHLEFARSLAAGHGFSFNGHIVAGDTAPLWVFFLTATHAFIPDWMIAGKTLTVLGAIFGLSGIYAFARKLAAQLLPTASVFPAAMVLLIVANPYSCYWLFSGMEPIAAAGLACFAVLSATRDRPTTQSFLTACLLAGIAPLLRPEMIFLTALLALPLLAQWRRLPASRARLAIFAAGLILLIAPLAIWSIYSLHAFGHLLPNTNAAKRAAPGESVLLRLATAYSLGFPIIVCVVIAAIARLIFRRTRSAPQSSPSLPVAAWIFILWPSIAAIFYIVNHTYVQTRYILVSAPGLTIVIVALALRSFPRAGRALYVAALAWAFAVSVVTVRPFLRNKAINCQIVSDLALYIHDRIPPDAPVATYSIGEIAFVSEHPIVDTGGITRPGAIPYFYAPPQAMTRWAASQGAQYYIAGAQPEPGAIAVYTASTPFIGWSLHPALYSTFGEFSLWKLAPIPQPPQPAADPAADPAAAHR